MTKINWFWAHRRNSSLHHMSLIARGFHSKGFLPVVDFHFRNQIFVGEPGKGVYIFYDRDELDRKCRDIQQSIEKNKNFAQDFKKISDNIFSALFAVCKKIKETDLGTVSDECLLQLLIEFKEKITVGPIITVQLWGIEACWDEEYLLARELHSKVSDEQFPRVKGKLSQSTGKSVALSEKESFLKVCSEIQKVSPLREEFQKSRPDEILLTLERFPEVKALLQEHITRFEWVHSEYLSKKWDILKWIEKVREGLGNDARTQLKSIVKQHISALQEKQEIIYQLKLSDAAQQIIDALNIFISERDWAKGKFCYALSVYDLLLQEVAQRLKISKEEILHVEAEELIEAMRKNERTPHLDKRKDGFALVCKEGDLKIVESQEIYHFLADEGIHETFSPVTRTLSFMGVSASQGKVRGRVRVIDNPKHMHEFKEGEILVTYMTTMEFTPLFGKARGIITDEGGMSSHAAIISREFGLPCVVGTQIATRNLKTGDLIELDASAGKITVLEN